MKRSPPPTPIAGREHEEDDVDVLEGRVHGRLHPLRQLVHRLLEAGQVDEHELVVLAVRDAVDPASRGIRNGRGDRDLLADERVHERRLAHVRAARDGDEARLHPGGSSQVSGSRSAAAYDRDRPVGAPEAHLADPELGEPLAAAAARRGGDPDRGEVARPIAGGDCPDDRALLGADAERIGRVLHVHALELTPVARADDRADEIVRVRRVRLRRNRLRLFDEPAHGVSWKTARVTSAPRAPPYSTSVEE